MVAVGFSGCVGVGLGDRVAVAVGSGVWSGGSISVGVEHAVNSNSIHTSHVATRFIARCATFAYNLRTDVKLLESAVPVLTVSHRVPYTCQYASPGLVRAFIHEGRPLETDPRWADFGATDPAEYAHWARRSCGVVCIKMAVEALTDDPPRSVINWVQAGLDLGGYITRLRPDRPGERVELGWRHDTLVQLATGAGVEAGRMEGLTLADVVEHIRADRLLISSVTSELGEEGPLTRNSGHLVLVYGIETDESGKTTAIILHNPSGRTADLQAGARIPAARFEQAFSGRAIILRKRRRTGIDQLPKE
jgi:hypothetical protein